MTREDRAHVHYEKLGGDKWTACGKRAALLPTTVTGERVTCPACLTHVTRIETPGNVCPARYNNNQCSLQARHAGQHSSRLARWSDHATDKF